jgi:O-antigen ligase
VIGEDKIISERISALRLRLGLYADVFAIGTVVALPWSATLQSIFIALWLIALVPTLTWTDVRREIVPPVGGLPVLLFVLGLAGMVWAQEGWPIRLGAFSTFLKFLLIPFFLVQFRRSDRGISVLVAYIASCTALMAVSWTLNFWPTVALTANHSPHFAICSLTLLFVSVALLRRGERRLAAGALALAVGFLGTIIFVVMPNLWLPLMLPLAVIPLGISVLFLKQPEHRAWCILFVTVVTACGVLWVASDPPRYEFLLGDRPMLWQRSLVLISEAPIIGHGTGAVPRLIAQAAIERGGSLVHAATDPRQQTLAVGIQLGLVGVAVLWAMWIAHLLFFRGNALCEWVGFVVVTQSIFGSMFDTQLSGSWGGWTYVIGVGVAGGMVRRLRAGHQSGDAHRLVL